MAGQEAYTDSAMADPIAAGGEGSSSGDAALLQEIRERYSQFTTAWADARKESKTDRRYAAGDPWDPKDRQARENGDDPRPCISHDELNQYLNQAANNVRKSRHGIKVTPGSKGSEKRAEFRANLIRTIEARSHAQQAYISAFEAMLRGSYGAFRISRRFVHEGIPDGGFDASWFDQEIVIKAIANPDAVLYDPDCSEPDWSDAQACFVLPPQLTRKEFKRKYPRAKVQDFTAEHMRQATGWVTDNKVLVAEYWRVEVHGRVTVHLLADGSTVQGKLPAGQEAVVTREEGKKRVVQYITNGIEILERIPQPGTIIPIVFLTGPRVYLDPEDASKWVIGSLIRLARNPQMSLAYLCSQEMEEAGLTPKVPYMGYKGQFESDWDAWETLTKISRAFVQVDPVVDAATGAVLPLPKREQFTPHFSEYEVAKEAARRAIQAAMGVSPLPTAAQRDNQKSGVALQKIEAQQAIGSYHFVDSYDRAIELAGRIVESWIPVTYDTEREIGLHLEDGKHQPVRMNTAEPYLNETTGQMEHYPVQEEDFDLAISTGPSSESQWQIASDFLDLLVGNLGKLPISSTQQARLLALAIRMRQLGPSGDEMAEIISPSQQGQELPPQAIQAIQQARTHLQAINTYAQQLEAYVQKLEMEKAGKVVDNQFKLDLEKLRIEADIAKAEISTKAQSMEERLKFVEDAWMQLRGQAHEQDMLAADQAHQLAMAQQAPADVVQPSGGVE